MKSMSKSTSSRNNLNKSNLYRQFCRQMIIPIFIITFTSTLFAYEKLSKDKISNNMNVNIPEWIENHKEDIVNHVQNNKDIQVSCTPDKIQDFDDEDENSMEFKLKFNCRFV